MLAMFTRAKMRQSEQYGNFLLCLHVEMSSVLEFKIVDFSAVMMWYFSHRQRLQRFVLGEYGWAFRMIHHDIV